MADPSDQERAGFYRRYLDRCNDHAFDRLDEFVAAEVHVNGEQRGLGSYVQGLEDVVRAFPDYHWELRHLLVDEPMLAAHLVDTGTHLGTVLDVPPTGRAVSLHEFAVYRIAAGRIAEVWGNLHLPSLLR
jgi:predicted ester cyclase